MRGRVPWDGLAVAVAALVLFTVTAAPDLGIIDSGELAAVCAEPGIAHPTGYPLYTLLGRVAVALSPLEPIRTLNLLSAVLAAGAVLGVALAARKVLERLSGSGPSAGIPPLWVAWTAGAFFATDRIFWEQAIGNEVYALHVLLVAWAVERMVALSPGPAAASRAAHASSRAKDAAPQRPVGVAPWWGALGYLVGLGLGNHLSILFLVPAIALCSVLALPRAGSRRRAWLGRVAWLGGCALLGWSVVLYLPIRSAQEPMLDWGAPSEWSAFFRHVFAAQYRVWFLESEDTVSRNLGLYLRMLPDRLSWPVLGLGLVGTVELWRRWRPLAAVLALIAIVTALWASGYEILDLEPYFLPADLVLCVWAAVGLSALGSWSHRLVPRARPSAPLTGTARDGHTRPVATAAAVAVLAGLVAAGTGASRFERVDRSEDRFVRFHATTLLDALPPGAVVLSAFWDAFVSPSLYLQYVEGHRTDVTVVDPELMRRSWYIPQLRRSDPELLDPAAPVLPAFLDLLRAFEGGHPFDPAEIERLYRTVIERIAQGHRPGRVTAYTPDLASGFVGDAVPVPEGLVVVLREEAQASPAMDPPPVSGLFASGYRSQDRIHRTVVQQWRVMIQNRIRFLETFGRMDEVERWERAAGELERGAAAAGSR